MTIDRIGSVDPIQPGKKTGGANQVKAASITDSISISSEAVEKAELYRVRELVAAAPESNTARIEELKAKINDPSYLNSEVINATADKLIDALLR
jgi:negative regulator of flagellin synthesis FlgM